MTNIQAEYRAAFDKAYEELNEKQKLAVETIEGPVMTIAGPGTGKTQLLAVRIGNILLKTDVFPHNILCLTYTDAGAIAMRQRLASFIGPEAYNVNIFTFHAFCNSVIKENMQYFGDFRDLQSLSDIEEIEVFRAIIDEFPSDHPLKRLKGQVYFDVKRIKDLMSTMKQENWTAETIQAAYEEYKELISSTDDPSSDYVYKTRRFDKKTNTQYEKGDLNINRVNEELKKYQDGLAASRELVAYKKEMKKRERFDYQDMVLWVIDKFKTNDGLLGKYQERFQYILVDEYQDTNGSQNELLFLLADYWEEPNLFIVGDDDQSIFRFQGANMNSIIDFKNKFNPLEIVLTDNYRSSQKVLDRAKTLIENNKDRLVSKYDYLTKDLTEKRPNWLENAPDPIFVEYQNETQEEVGIIKRINDLVSQGVAYKDMGVIYTKHKAVDNLVRYFFQKKIPINVKKRVNVLQENEVLKLITILRYLDVEYSKPYSGEDLLFEILHYDHFGLSALDIAAVSIFCRRKQESENEPYRKWRDVLSDKALLTEAGVRNIEKVFEIGSIIEQWISDIANVTIQILIERILTFGNIMYAILQGPDKAWKLQLVNTFFDFIKNESAKTKTLTLKQSLALVDILIENNIDLPIYKIISSENGINFMSAHGSKGLEFDHVFIIRGNDNYWEKKANSNQSFRLPPTLTASTDGSEIEDDRRLMYVAMTRAKNHLYISYSSEEDAGKKLIASKFIAETIHSEKEIIKESIAEVDIMLYKAELMKYQQGEISLIDNDLIDKVLENFKLSATSLNKYLKCRLTFYFENILRVPLGRSASMGFGNAIHYSLEQFFRDIEDSVPRSLGSVKKMIAFFNKGMEMYRSHFTGQEFENYSIHGENILTDYYNEYHGSWLATRKYELEYSIPSTEYKGVPISGKLDRINIYDDHVSVTDYKTGKYDSKKLKGTNVGDEEDLGGDYWRQIVFYRLLLDGDKRNHWLMKKAYMDFVEKDDKDNYRNVEFTIEAFETEIVSQQLVDTYNNIKTHQFTPGCNDEKCKWCNFVKRSMPITLTEETEDNIESE